MDPNTTTSAPARIQSSIRSFFQTETNTAAPLTVPLVAKGAPQRQSSQQIPQTQPTWNAKEKSSIHPQAKIAPIGPDHIQALRRINSLLLPINYPDSFYHKILEPSPVSLSRVILWEDAHSKETKVIGGLVCRLDPSLTAGSGSAAPRVIDGSYDVYLQSLVLLSPYREKGLAATALDSVIQAATRSDDLRIRALYAHVWTENIEALEWYAARGFQRDEMIIKGYYKRLKPDTAWVLRRNLMPSDHLVQAVSRQQTGPNQTLVQQLKSTAQPEIAEPRPTNLAHTTSFQDRRPDMEWNDLPEDVLGGSLLKAPVPRSGEGSSASSRSTSRSGQGRKKTRAYPAAAFGS